MPIFMDRHDIPGLTAMDVAEGHKQDLKIQHKYRCRALTYWYDEKRGTAFCLIEAPEKALVEKMHDDAHGLIPKKIIEVDENLVEAFLGRITDPEMAVKPDNPPLFLINEPAFRIIMVTQLQDAPLMRYKYGNKFLIAHNEVIQEAIKKYDCQEVRGTAEGFMASFISASNAINCAIEIQKKFKTHKKFKIETTIGLSAGEPVTDNDDFFGEVIQFGKRLCCIGGIGKVIISSAVKKEYEREKVNFISDEKTIRILNPSEEQFLNRFMDVIDKFWNKESFNVTDLQKQIAMSKSQLYRRLTSLTGKVPGEFIKKFRLRKALELIEKQNLNISQIAFETGFDSPSYFSKCFKKQYGVLPSVFAQLNS